MARDPFAGLAPQVFEYDPSVAHRAAVLAGVRAADEDAVLQVDADRLVAAEGTGGLDEAMPLGLESAADLGGDPRLQGDRAAAVSGLAGRLRRAEVAEPRRVAGLLDVHAEVDQVA